MALGMGKGSLLSPQLFRGSSTHICPLVVEAKHSSGKCWELESSLSPIRLYGFLNCAVRMTVLALRGLIEWQHLSHP